MKRIINFLITIMILTVNSFAINNDQLVKLIDKSNSNQYSALTGNIELEKEEMEIRKEIIRQQKIKEIEAKKKKQIMLNSSSPFEEEDYLRGARDLNTMKNILKNSNPPPKVRKLINSTIKYIGKPYVWGGDDITTLTHSYDCSGFTRSIYGKMGITLPRTANGQKNVVKKIEPREAKMGDLIFFENTYPTTGASHVGIYLTDGYMIHASSGKGHITVDSLMNTYWINHFLSFGRIVVKGDK